MALTRLATHKNDGNQMNFTLSPNGLYESTWKLGRSDIPVTIYDSDTRKPELAEPHLSRIKPLLQQWTSMKDEVKKELHLRDKNYNLSKIAPVELIVDVRSRKGKGAACFCITAHLVDLLPGQDFFASVFGTLENGEIQSIEVRSGY